MHLKSHSPPVTPPSLAGQDDSAQAWVDEVSSIYQKLVQLENYRPGPDMDLLLGRLVSMCSQTLDGTTVRMVSTLFNVASAELSDPPNQILQSAKLQMILPPLHNICATAECELEAHWAAKIWQSGDPWKCLEQFPYLDNYSELTRIEMCSIHAVNPSPIRSVAFIGSGPLPLTSLALLKKLRHPSLPLFAVDSVTNIDISRDAINASQAMARRLGLDCDKMRFQLADAADPALDLKRYDVVYLAALVGESQAQKENLLASVACRMRPEATLVTRSCHGLKTVLYQELDVLTPHLLDHLDIGLVVHPYGPVINSVIVATVKCQ